jgi:hypothetical protein
MNVRKEGVKRTRNTKAHGPGRLSGARTGTALSATTRPACLGLRLPAWTRWPRFGFQSFKMLHGSVPVTNRRPIRRTWTYSANNASQGPSARRLHRDGSRSEQFLDADSQKT